MNTLILPIPGFAGYFADSEGHIWSSHRGRWGHRYSSMHPLKPHTGRDGYLDVRLWTGTKPLNKPIHVLVALAFLGPRPATLVVCHRDGSKLNNTPTNLMYVTHAENIRQAIEHGTFVRGERCHTAKLSDDQVRAIVTRLKQGERQAALAREYGVTVGTIWSIKTGRTRRYLALVPAREATA